MMGNPHPIFFIASISSIFFVVFLTVSPYFNGIVFGIVPVGYLFSSNFPDVMSQITLFLLSCFLAIILILKNQKEMNDDDGRIKKHTE